MGKLYSFGEGKYYPTIHAAARAAVRLGVDPQELVVTEPSLEKRGATDYEVKLLRTAMRNYHLEFEEE